jgi:hypothetical protein
VTYTEATRLTRLDMCLCLFMVFPVSVILFHTAYFMITVGCVHLQESKDWGLSTSNGSGPYLAMFGFAAVTTHGYGNGYLIEDNKVNVVISCFHSCAMTSSKNMKDAISATLESMQGLVKK